MRVFLLGNAGAGKSTLAARLRRTEPAALLALDDVAFEGGAVRRPLADSVRDVERFLDAHESWIVEGCYADLFEPLLGRCDTLLFLDPGVEACVAHCRARPWEPDKWASKEAQDAHLEALVEWVRTYDTRDDEYGRRRHRALFDAFEGEKRVYARPEDYGGDELPPSHSRGNEPRTGRRRNP